jgi:hypothetical protein
MKSTCLAILVALFAYSTLSAQSHLKPHIGVDSQPLLSDPICDIPLSLEPFENVGYLPGDTVNDFTLFSYQGEERILSEMLSDGLPVLLINGNYTCWRFRDQIDAINSVATYYEGQLKVFVVYTVEAHPHIDISPYFGEVWTGSRNFSDDVLLRQPTTYGERQENIDVMLGAFNLVPEILLDGPCNQWWEFYGPAPNNAYLIDPTGIVQFRHVWANQIPETFWCDLGTYFQAPHPACNDAGMNGSFEISLEGSSGNIGYGYPGETITVPATIHNLSETENVAINIIREEVYTPENWSTSLCVDVCLPPQVSSTTVVIPPGESQSFLFYFYTGAEQGTGSAVVRFVNANLGNNQEYVEFSAITGVATGLTSKEAWSVRVYPNPTSQYLFVQLPESAGISEWQILSTDGKLIKNGIINSSPAQIDVHDLLPGTYILRSDGIQDGVNRFVVTK